MRNRYEPITDEEVQHVNVVSHLLDAMGYEDLICMATLLGYGTQGCRDLDDLGETCASLLHAVRDMEFGEDGDVGRNTSRST